MADNKSDIQQISSRQVHKTKFDGMLLFDLNIFEDPRGHFTEVWQTEAMQSMGLPAIEPKQLGIAHSKKGTIRAVHAEPYDKLVHTVRGRIFCAMVDLRTHSSTFGQVDTFELGPGQMLFIPKGVGNYVYCVTGVWSAEKAYSGQYLAINYADPDLNIKWPIGPEGWIVSLKDQQNPTMRQTFPEKFNG
jgi:dTDP-4-dehydrorhamnose 3,5-epimerase